MTLGEVPRRLTSPRATGIYGFVALAALLGGVLASQAAFPGYSVYRGYISELADPGNPGRHWFTLGLALAGPHLLLFSLGLGYLLKNRAGRITAWLLATAALSLPVVAFIPFTKPIPHLVAAIFLFGSTILSTLFAGIAFHRAAASARRPGPLRVASSLATAVFGFQVAITVAGIVFTGYLVTQIRYTTLTQLLVELPAHQLVRLWRHGPVINPAALLEWVFLFTALLLFAVASVFALTRSATQIASAVNRAE